MKRLTQGLLAVALGLALAVPASAFTGSYDPGTGINNTVHDLGHAHNGMNYTAVPADPLQRICIFCHAPHNTYRLNGTVGGAGPEAPSALYDYLPLWNHTLQDPNSYTMYDNGPGAPTTGPKASQAIILGLMSNPGGASLLCLSCHDGSVAVNSYGNGDQRPQSISTGSTFIMTAYAIGQDQVLSNHHPIGFNYDDVQSSDPEIREADVFQITPTTFIRDHLMGSGNSQLECESCHDVHNKGNAGEALLWRSDQNSELCLTCHDKGSYTAP